MGATDTTSRHTARPLALGRNGRRRTTLRNRLVSAPMERNYGTTDGKGRIHQLGLHDDATVPGLRALTDALHAEGVLAPVELSHGGRTAHPEVLDGSGPEPGSGQGTGPTTDDRRRAAPGIGAGR